MTRSMVKKNAKACLSGKTIRAFRITLCIASAAVLGGFASFYLIQLSMQKREMTVAFLAAQLMLLVLTSGFLGSVRQGRTAWQYCCACGKEPSVIQFLYWLRRGRGFRAAALHLEIFVRKAVWIAVLCMPGAALLYSGVRFSVLQTGAIPHFTWIGGAAALLIGLLCSLCIGQKYALAPVLFAKSPEIGARCVMRESCRLMDGACMRLLLLKLSFLPWMIACVSVVPIVYVVPYSRQAVTCMLRDILNNNAKQHKEN